MMVSEVWLHVITLAPFIPRFQYQNTLFQRLILYSIYSCFNMLIEILRLTIIKDRTTFSATSRTMVPIGEDLGKHTLLLCREQ